MRASNKDVPVMFSVLTAIKFHCFQTKFNQNVVLESTPEVMVSVEIVTTIV